MSSSQPERITGRSVYPYADELIVELRGVDDDGVIVVVSYQFEYEDGQAHVEQKGPVEPEHVPQVRDALAENDFEWTDTPGT